MGGGGSSSFVQPCQPDQPGEYAIVPVLLSTLDGISHIRIFLPKDLKPPEARQTAFQSVHEVQRRFVTGIALLDPVENMGITDDQFKKLLRRIEMLESKLLASPLHETPQLATLYDTYHQKQEIANKIRATKKKIASAHSVMHLDELKNRKRALRRLGFATSEDVVEMKGRVACEISTGDELLLTELIFNGAFTDLDPEQCAALLSCFVFSEKVRLARSILHSVLMPSATYRARRPASSSKSSRVRCARCKRRPGGSRARSRRPRFLSTRKSTWARSRRR